MSHFEKAEECVIHQLENMVLAGAELSLNSNLFDLGLDSLDRLELVMDIEEQLDIDIDDDFLVNLETVEDVVHFVAKRLEKK